MKQFGIFVRTPDGKETTVELVSAKEFVKLAGKDKETFEEKSLIAQDARKAADEAKAVLDAVPAGTENTKERADFEEKDRVAKTAQEDADAAWKQCEANAKLLPEVLKAIESEEKDAAEREKYRKMIAEIAQNVLDTKGALGGLAKMLDDINNSVKSIDAKVGAGGGGVLPGKTLIRIVYF